ncbi:hypothetical protein FRB90_007739, partial [Tulasnella sp. 427]
MYKSLVATALLLAGAEASLGVRQAESAFTTVITTTVDATASDRPIICNCPLETSTDVPVPTTTTTHSIELISATGGGFTLPVTSSTGAVAKKRKRQDAATTATTTITENLP